MFAGRWRKHAHGTNRAPNWHAGTPRRRTLVKAPKQAKVANRGRRGGVGNNREAVLGFAAAHRPDHPGWNNGTKHVESYPFPTPRPHSPNYALCPSRLVLTLPPTPPAACGYYCRFAALPPGPS